MISARLRILFQVTFLKHFALEVWVSIVYLKICVIIVIMFNVHVKSILKKNEIVDKQFQAHSIDEKITNMLYQKLRKII